MIQVTKKCEWNCINGYCLSFLANYDESRCKHNNTKPEESKEPLVGKLTYDKIKEVKDALGEPGIGALRIVENQFLPDDMVIVSSKMYKALKANP